MAVAAQEEILSEKRLIRIFRAESMKRSPFRSGHAPHPVLAAAGICFVDDPAEADVILAERIKFLKEYCSYDKSFAIWTHEPRCDFETGAIAWRDGFPGPIHIMNAHNGRIYGDEFYNFDPRKLDFDGAMRAFAAKPHRAVMLATYRRPPTSLVRHGIDHDLLQYRQRLAICLKDCGFCDIYGRSWPKTTETTCDDRAHKWRAQKMEVLKGYAINLAFENTLSTRYVTEKIWDAVAGICLPVYHGGNGIRRIFPNGSFVDADGKSPEELSDEIIAMPKNELSARFEACLKAYLDIYDTDLQNVSRLGCHYRTVKFLEGVIADHATRQERMRKSIWLRAARQVGKVRWRRSSSSPLSVAARGEFSRDGRIRIFRADAMSHTPFAEGSKAAPVLESAGVTYVAVPEDSDVIVARAMRYLEQYGNYDKAYAIWTHEPRLSLEAVPVASCPAIRNPIHVMNAHTGDIFSDEFYYFSGPKVDFDTGMQAFADKPRRAVMLASYRAPPTSVMRNGMDLDLLQYRQRLGVYLKDRGFCDIHGRNWPKTIEIVGNSREKNRTATKMEILKGYAINLCLENTIAPRYVTEKIWEAVAGACLPVYHGGNGIYRVFPKESFIDADGKSVEELADEILAMPKDEMTGRFEACLKVCLAANEQRPRKKSHLACYDRTVEFINRVVPRRATYRRQQQKTIGSRAAKRFREATRKARGLWRHLSSSRDRKYSRT